LGSALKEISKHKNIFGIGGGCSADLGSELGNSEFNENSPEDRRFLRLYKSKNQIFILSIRFLFLSSARIKKRGNFCMLLRTLC